MIDRFQACLLGFAIGDALAAPIEDTIRDPHIGQDRVTDYVKALPSHPLHHLEPGQYSDETQQMLLLAETVAEKRGFLIEPFAARLVDWYHRQKTRAEWRFPGNTCMNACRKLATGTPWQMSGSMSAGVIASARVAPLGLFYARNANAMRDAIEKSCKITHTDPKVVAGAMVLARIIQVGVEGQDLGIDGLINGCIEKCQPYSPELVKKLAGLKDQLKLDPKLAISNIGNTGYVLDAIPAAVYCYLKWYDRFDDMIVAAANIGGDSDAIAAMAGAMFGATRGLTAIPARWLPKLERADEIKQLGCDLYRAAQAK